MLVFVDESGDTGLKLDSGSSEYFTVTLVLFEDHDEAQACDDRITLLRRELNKGADYEFHFKENADSIRKAFFEAVLPYQFFYFSFVINKRRLYGPGFAYKGPFYKYVCNLVFTNAKPHLDNAIVKIDACGDREFQDQLSAYLKKKINDKESSIKHIKKVSTQNSHGNNLLQLADMVCGAVARSYRADKANSGQWRNMIRAREMQVQFWPK